MLLQVHLLRRLDLLCQMCKKVHDEKMTIDLLQRTLGLLPEELLGSEFVGVVYAELARSHLQQVLQTPELRREQRWGIEREGVVSRKRV